MGTGEVERGGGGLVCASAFCVDKILDPSGLQFLACLSPQSRGSRAAAGSYRSVFSSGGLISEDKWSWNEALAPPTLLLPTIGSAV